MNRRVFLTVAVYFVCQHVLTDAVECDDCHQETASDKLKNCFNATNSAYYCLKNVLIQVISNPNHTNVSTNSLITLLNDELEKFAQQKKFSIDIGDTKLIVHNKENGNFDLSIKTSNSTDLAERKMKMKMENFLPYLIAPAFLMAGVMPWILPKLKIAVMLVGLINNIAFSQALFSLVRNYVFNTVPEEHIIYLNNGYKNKKKHIYHPPIPQAAHTDHYHHR